MDQLLQYADWENNSLLQQLAKYVVEHTVTVSLAGTAIMGYAVWKLSGKSYNLPPGPTPLPIIDLPKGIQNVFIMLKRDYGDISTVSFGPQRMITLNSARLVREALIRDDLTYADRPSLVQLELLTNYGQDIFGAKQYSPRIQVQRKIALGALRTYAHGELLEKHLQQSFDAFCKEVDKTGTFIPLPTAYLVAYNILASMAFGKGFEFDDPFLLKMMETQRKIEILAESRYAVLFLTTFLKYLPTPFMKSLHALVNTFHSFITENYNEHIETFQKDKLTDFTYHVINTMLETESDPNEKNKIKLLSDENFYMIIFDLFFAGTETSRLTLAWIWQYLAAFPEVQKRAQTEVDSVLGPDGKVTYKCREKLPYIDAILHEVMRIRPVVPAGIPRATTKDTKLGGYDIPKGSFVMNNAWAIHHDENEWKDPEAFLPERWLDENGQYQFQDNGFLPFSVGRRSCVGESFAKLEFLMLTTMVLQKYTLKPQPGRTVNLNIAPGRTMRAPDQVLVAERRN